MNHKLLALTLALTSAPALLSSKSSASASASATARADDPANRARPETDTKSAKADVKNSSAKSLTADDLTEQQLLGSQCPFQLKECAELYEAGKVCEHLRYEVDLAIHLQSRHLRPQPHDLTVVEYPMFFQRELTPFDTIWQKLQQHPHFPKELARLVHAYAHNRFMDFHICFKDAPSKCNARFMGRFNLDSLNLLTDGIRIEKDNRYTEICSSVGKTRCPSDTIAAHPHTPYIICPPKIRKRVLCEHLTIMALHAFAWSHLNISGDTRSESYQILDGTLVTSPLNGHPTDIMHVLIQDKSNGTIWDCECYVGVAVSASYIIRAQQTDKTKLD